MRMRVFVKNLRVEIENETRVFLESLDFEIEMRVLQKSRRSIALLQNFSACAKINKLSDFYFY